MRVPLPLMLHAEEFLNLMTAKMGERDSKEEILKAFRLFDDDGSGTITFKVGTPGGRVRKRITRPRMPRRPSNRPAAGAAGGWLPALLLLGARRRTPLPGCSGTACPSTPVPRPLPPLPSHLSRPLALPHPTHPRTHITPHPTPHTPHHHHHHCCRTSSAWPRSWART
jgi:hypothetical protein